MKLCPRVLFVSHTKRLSVPYVDPSVRYRCFNPAEDVRRLGGIADVVPLQHFDVGLIDCYDHYIFHRPVDNDGALYRALDLMRSHGKTFSADYDDLVFAPDHALHSSIFLNGLKSREETLAIFGRNFEAFRAFDRFTVSTRPLASHVQQLNPRAVVDVIPNGLSTSLLQALGLKKPGKDPGRPRGPRFVISYFSGTASHNPDFAFVQEVLSRFLQRRRECCLLVAGPLEFDRIMFPRESLWRIKHKPYPEFLQSAGMAMLNIAPLAPRNQFNECKSALKFFESAIFGIPTIASPIDDFRRFSDTRGLVLADCTSEWDTALNRFLDPAEYGSRTNGLREYCWLNCRSESATQRLLQFVQRKW